MLYYAAFMLIACLIFIRKRPRKGMRLKLLGQKRAQDAGLPGAVAPTDEERSLNVVFNYNGHSWDAYEVLGLPAGSSMESVEVAYQESLRRVDEGSKAFMQAAYEAIQSQRKTYKAANGG